MTKKEKKIWVAEKDGETPRVAKYASSLFVLEKNGFTIRQGKMPKKCIYIYVKRPKAISKRFRNAKEKTR